MKPDARADVGHRIAGLEGHGLYDLARFLPGFAFRGRESLGDTGASFLGLVAFVGFFGDLRECGDGDQQEVREFFHRDFSMGMASGGSIRKSFDGHFHQCFPDGLLGRRFHRDDERPVAPVVGGQLQHRFQTDLLVGQHARQRGDDARPVFHAEAQSSRPSAAA